MTPAHHHVTLPLDSWSEVLRMCARRAAGEMYVRVRGPEAELGDPVRVKLTLPDALSLVVEGQVQGLLYDPAGGLPTLVIELVGFTHELAVHLESVVARARQETAHWLGQVEPVLVDSRKVSALVRGDRWGFRAGAAGAHK
jgi:hypothetical protein